MASIFGEIDLRLSPKFWESQLSMRECIVLNEHSGLYKGDLYIKRDLRVLKKRHFIGNEETLYYLKSSSDLRVLKSTNINWKTMEAFIENNNQKTMYGFRLKGGKDYFDFYTPDEESLIYWIDNIGRFTINKDIRDDYEFLKEVGRGVYATVHKAKEKMNGSTVAIKSIPKFKVLGNSQYIQSIYTEIAVLRAIKHPSIINIYKVYEENEYVYLVMEYARGGDFTSRVLKEGKLKENEAKTLIKSVTEVLLYLKQSHVIYRNLGTGSILMKYRNNCEEFKLCDFGKSVLLNDNRTGLFNDSDTDYSGDMYSLGVLINVSLTGRFSFNKYQDVYRAIGKPSLPAQAQTAIDLLTHESTEMRPTPEEFLNDQWLKHSSNQRTESSFDQTLKYLESSMNPRNFQTYLRMMGLNSENEDEAEVIDDQPPTGVLPEARFLLPGSKFNIY